MNILTTTAWNNALREWIKTQSGEKTNPRFLIGLCSVCHGDETQSPWLEVEACALIQWKRESLHLKTNNNEQFIASRPTSSAHSPRIFSGPHHNCPNLHTGVLRVVPDGISKGPQWGFHMHGLLCPIKISWFLRVPTPTEWPLGPKGRIYFFGRFFKDKGNWTQNDQFFF